MANSVGELTEARTCAPGCHCPFVLCLHPQDCLRVGFYHRVLIKSGPGNRGLSACGTTRELRLEFPRETGLILKCPVKVGNPLQTKQGKRPSYRKQEGRRGSDNWCREPRCSPRVRPIFRGTFGVTSRVSSIILHSHQQCTCSLEVGQQSVLTSFWIFANLRGKKL